jgi:hypothetical protein
MKQTDLAMTILKLVLVLLIYLAVLGGGILVARYIDHRKRTAVGGRG